MTSEQIPEPPATSTQAVQQDNLDLLQSMELEVTVVLGRTGITLDDALVLQEQSVIDLDKIAGEPVDILLNDQLFAYGQVVTVQEHFGVCITEIVGKV